MNFTHVGADIETNGLDPEKNEIIEISVIEFNLSGEIGDRINFLCCPSSGVIPSRATEINGITMDMVKDKPNYLSDGIREKVVEFIGSRIVVGHNIEGFDIKFMKINPRSMGDTLLMCRKKYASGNSLKNACRRVGIGWDDEGSHRAEYDVLKTIELYIKMNDEERTKKIQGELPLFGRMDGATDEDFKSNGIVPSEEDQKMIATQAYSYSRINLFLNCPFKWYMQYIKGHKAPDEGYFQTGRACHSVAEWANDWCARRLFANKFVAYFTVKGYRLGDKMKQFLSKYFKKEGIHVEDFGFYLYDNPVKIQKYFKGIKGKASMVYEIDENISEDMYEKPSMPDWDTYEFLIQEAINRNKITDPDIIKEVYKIMSRFYELEDFSLMPGDVSTTEKKLAFDRNWAVVNSWFAKNIFFRGIIDVIDYFGNYVVITDYKSSRTMLTMDQLKEDKQTMVYLLLIYMFLPKEAYTKIVIRIKYIRFSKTVEYEVTDVKSVADKALKWINDSIQSIEREMLKTDGTAFQPIRNEYCHTCHLAIESKCPLFDKRVINNIDDPLNFVIANKENCVTAWKRVEANKAENSRLQSACKSFVKNCTDPIIIDENTKLDFYAEETRTYLTGKTMAKLLEKNVDIHLIAKFASLSPSSFDALCEKAGVEFTDEERDKISKKGIKKTFDAFTDKEIKNKKFINS
jgi:DNA polymerase III epsilon subunit-like protein